MARCWIIHKFGKWKSYNAVYEGPAVEVHSTPGEFTWGTTTGARRKWIEERQERTCDRCGYKQDRKVEAR